MMEATYEAKLHFDVMQCEAIVGARWVSHDGERAEIKPEEALAVMDSMDWCLKWKSCDSGHDYPLQPNQHVEWMM